MFTILRLSGKSFVFVQHCWSCHHWNVSWCYRSNSTMTVGSVCEALTKRLEQHDVPEARISIDLMVAHILGRHTLFGVSSSVPLNIHQTRQLEAMCEKRIKRMPVQYIIGEWDFCDFTLKVRPPTLIPRPETEELANYVTSYVKSLQQLKVKILDIGSGSGALIIAILKALPLATGVAVDIAEHACSLTSENAELIGVDNRLTVKKLDISIDVVELTRLSTFDLIVSNPPYLTDKCFHDVEAELSFEDRVALYGGPDGLDVTRSILTLASKLLKPNGSVWMELGLGQPLEVKNLVEEQSTYNLQYVETLKDFTNRDRFCHLKHKEPSNYDPSSRKQSQVHVT